ncbi:hypothetical protein CRENBAI_006805 [Crenichthys baileyi]|uniref:Uncharacterized protein n=1 Tax=Crenichthys baileyi TaxID=28760 RepID=A0AAV9SLD6_9TELE
MKAIFSYYGNGHIYHIPRIMYQFKYIKILEEVMTLCAEEEISLNGCLNHTMTPKTTVSKQHPCSRTNKMNILELPAQTSELNLIENMFLKNNQEMQRNCGMQSSHPGLEKLFTGAGLWSTPCMM